MIVYDSPWLSMIVYDKVHDRLCNIYLTFNFLSMKCLERMVCNVVLDRYLPSSEPLLTPLPLTPILKVLLNWIKLSWILARRPPPWWWWYSPARWSWSWTELDRDNRLQLDSRSKQHSVEMTTLNINQFSFTTLGPRQCCVFLMVSWLAGLVLGPMFPL